MSSGNSKKRWERTSVTNLLRHGVSGRYYARFKVGGKQKWIALGTDIFSVAKLRIADKSKRVLRQRTARNSINSGTCAMGDLLTVYKAHVAARVDLDPKSRKRMGEHCAYLGKTWPGFESLQPDEITRQAVSEWRNRALTDGTGYRPPGAKGNSKAVAGLSPSSFNKAVDVLRSLLNVAVERGALAANPLIGRGIKAKVTLRKPHLPEAAVLRAICDEIESGSGLGGWGLETADLCRFLMFTGCRKSEAAAVRWSDIDRARGIIRVAGTKTESAAREVPLIPAATALLEKIRTRRLKSAAMALNGEPQIDPAAPVLAVREAQGSLDRACAKLNAERLTHHDFRDAFATQAIEAGVDIPTIAAWLGHADGGTLLMRVYAHHRRAHSVAAAAKVNF